MAKMKFTAKQQKLIKTLVTAIGKDASLRDRLQSDPRAVFKEHGLANLLPDGLDLEITLGQPGGGPVVVARTFASTGHWDFIHVDIAAPDGNPPVPHIDFPHVDVAARRTTGGTRVQVKTIKRD
jgi:hypothetical protein